MNRPRVDWLTAGVWLSLLAVSILFALGIVGGLVWVFEQLVLAFGPWIIAHVEAVVIAICAAGVIGIFVLAVRE